MSVLRKIGNFFGGVLRKVGQVGGGVLNVIGKVKEVADKSGITSALTGMLASNPLTAPIAAGLSLANPAIDLAKKVTNGIQQGGNALQNVSR